MNINILKEYALLEAMTPKELVVEWDKYYDHPPKSRTNKTYLVSHIIYRIQEMTYGGLTKRTISRLEALVDGKLARQRKTDPSRLAVGTRLVREHNGVEHHVKVLEEGYEYQGVKYKSLSGIAFAITGTRWNGNAFFGLMQPPVEKRPTIKFKKRKAVVA